MPSLRFSSLLLLLVVVVVVVVAVVVLLCIIVIITTIAISIAIIILIIIIIIGQSRAPRGLGRGSERLLRGCHIPVSVRKTPLDFRARSIVLSEMKGGPHLGGPQPTGVSEQKHSSGEACKTGSQHAGWAQPARARIRFGIVVHLIGVCYMFLGDPRTNKESKHMKHD